MNFFCGDKPSLALIFRIVSSYEIATHNLVVRRVITRSKQRLRPMTQPHNSLITFFHGSRTSMYLIYDLANGVLQISNTVWTIYSVILLEYMYMYKYVSSLPILNTLTRILWLHFFVRGPAKRALIYFAPLH